MRILVTNDDGIDSPGLGALAMAAVDAGHEVTIAAPTGERSGFSAAVGSLHDGTEIHTLRGEVPGAPDVTAFAVDGPPALCVLVAMLGAFGEAPEIVLSGINPGTNAGRGVLQSGTVGAALTAQTFGLSAMAVSQGHGQNAVAGSREHFASQRWETAAAVAGATLTWLLDQPRKTLVNINVPNLPLDEVGGVEIGRLAAFGSSRTMLDGTAPGPLRVRLEPRNVELRPDTDTAIEAAGKVAMTVLRPIGVAEPGDLAESVAATLGLPS